MYVTTTPLLNPVHVKEAVGHADLRTTMQYTHLAREHLRPLVDQEPKREELRDLAETAKAPNAAGTLEANRAGTAVPILRLASDTNRRAPVGG